MTRQLLTLGIVLSYGASLRGDERTYEIKLKNTSAGDTVLVKEWLREDMQMRFLKSDGQELRRRGETKVEEMVFEETVLEKPDKDKRATRLRRKYQKARINENGDQVILSYEGKTVLIEKREGRYLFRVEGGEQLTDKGAEPLERVFNRDPEGKGNLTKVTLPGKPVRVDETWKIDPRRFIEELLKGERKPPYEFDIEKGTITAKLLRAYEKDGKQFGVIEERTQLPIKTMMVGEEKVSCEAGSQSAMETTLDVCIDGSADTGTLKANLKMDVTAILKAPDGSEAKMVLTGRRKGEVNKVQQFRK